MRHLLPLAVFLSAFVCTPLVAQGDDSGHVDRLTN
jgi:hypothetical protein